MALILITLAGAGLVGCCGAMLGVDLRSRDRRGGRRMTRPRRLAVLRES